MDEDWKIREYMKEHSFSREKFIQQIKMMHQVSVDLGEPKKCRLKKIEAIESWTDIQLVKAQCLSWT